MTTSFETQIAAINQVRVLIDSISGKPMPSVDAALNDAASTIASYKINIGILTDTIEKLIESAENDTLGYKELEEARKTLFSFKNEK